MKYVLVQWSSGNIKSSILTENYVRDKSMLHDCTKEGLISFVTVQRGDVSTVKNKGKLGRIACISDDRKLLEEHQNLLLSEESEFVEDDIAVMPSSSPLKRPRLDNGVNGHEDLSSASGLRQKVSKLMEELSAERAKVRELQTLNQTLQKCLPQLLRNAMQSSKVITQLRTCPNCEQLYGNIEADTSIIDDEPSMTADDEPSTTNSIATVTTMPAISTITSEARSSHTSPLNTPSNISMVASPSIVSVHSFAGSPPSTPDTEFSVTLPSDADNNSLNTSAAAATENGKNWPLSLTPRASSRLLTPRAGTSTSEQTSTPFTIPLEVSYAATYRKMTLALLCHFFDKETLKVSSVTGSGGSAAKEGRQPLDKAIVDYIIETVQKRFPDVKPKAIKGTMAQKCKYLRLPRKKDTSKTTDNDVTVVE